MIDQSDHPYSTAAIVIVDNSSPEPRILTISREPSGHYPGLCGIPGGHLIGRETAISAALRELQEETGLNADNLRYLGYVNRYFHDKLEMHVFWAEYIGARPKSAHGVWLTRVELALQEQNRTLAPNILHAVDRALSSRAILHPRDLNSVDETLRRTAERIRRSVQEVDGKTGWNVYLDSAGPGIVGTAMGVLSLVHLCRVSHPPFEIIYAALDYLASEQLPDGAWSTRSLGFSASPPVTVATGLVMEAMMSWGYVYSKHIEKGCDWLRTNQNPQGYWTGSPSHSEPSTYATAVAIRVLSRYGSCDRAAQWLLSFQNTDGGWGVRPGEPSTHVHTAHVILSLNACQLAHARGGLDRAREFLLDSYAVNQKWFDLAEAQQVLDHLRIEWKHFAGPWVCLALLATGVPASNECISNTLERILTSQNGDGSWVHDLCVGRCAVWVIHDCLKLIDVAASKRGNESLSLDIRASSIDSLSRAAQSDPSPEPSLATQTRSVGFLSKVSLSVNLLLLPVILLAWFHKWIVDHLTATQPTAGSNLIFSVVAGILILFVAFIARQIYERYANGK
jgi:ADP-ribose pyrophosphatase YjhB (NUDIX family)